MDDLIHLVDDHTEFFKSHLDNLPAIERKIYLALSEIWDAATAREVARAARIDVNKTSSLLNRLVARGAVIVVGEGRRIKRYQVVERMYNIYHLMRRRGGQSNRVKAVVNFMVNFYGQEDLLNVTRLIVEEACHFDPELCKDHYVFYDAILQKVKSQELLEKIISSTPQSFLESPNAPLLVSDLMKNRILAQDSLFEGLRGEKERNGGKEQIPRERIKRKDEDKIRELLDQAKTLSKQPDKLSEAEQIYREAIELDPENTKSWSGLGELLQKNKERAEEAEQAFRKAVEINANYDWGWVNLGFFLSEQMGRFDGSEIAFRKAIEVNHNNEWAWIGLGQLLRKSKERLEEAEQAFRKATEVNANYDWGWVELGLFLQNYVERYEEAEAAYRKAIEINPDQTLPWGQLGELLHEKVGRYEEAEAAYRKAIAIDPDYAWAWGQLGQLLHEKTDRYEEAEAAYRKAIAIDPDYAWAWGHLGRLLHERMSRYEEAEAAYRKAIEIQPEVSLGWVLLGQLLFQSAKYHEAYDIFMKALEIEPQSLPVRVDLVALLLGKLNQPVEALALSNDFLKAHDGNPVPHNSFARTFYAHGGGNVLNHAEAWARKAVVLAPDNPSYHHTLACILAAMNRGQEALEPAQKYLDKAESLERSVADAIELFIRLAAGGCAREALKMLENSRSAQVLEPLLVGLRLFIGEDVKAAVEIMEVAKDVAKRIKELQQRLVE
jgi:tetratricopeptide (TPR) repeat protein